MFRRSCVHRAPAKLTPTMVVLNTTITVGVTMMDVTTVMVVGMVVGMVTVTSVLNLYLPGGYHRHDQDEQGDDRSSYGCPQHVDLRLQAANSVVQVLQLEN